MSLSGGVFCCSSLLIVCLYSSFNDATFITQPVSLNTILDSTVNFTCEATEVSLIFFYVGDVPAAEQINVDRGFTELGQVSINGTIRRRSLSVYAQEINNNTIISCFASPGDIRSDNATLRIQGLLAIVGELEWNFTNGSSVNLSWTAPYTLDNVPITGYYINDNSGRLLNTTELSYILSATDPTDPDVCNVTSVTVAAINEVGIGKANNISFYYQKVPSVMPPVSVIPSAVNGAVNEARQVSLNISINVSELCIGEYPNNITVIILDINNGVQDTPTVPPQVNDQLMISGTVSVPNDLNTFIINVTMSNNGGEFNDIPSFAFGFIGQVTNIRSVINTCDSVNVTWDGPTIDDRISVMYNLSVFDSTTGVLLDNVTVNDTMYTFTNVEDLFLYRYTYVITGVNELGEGISNNKTFSYQRVPRSAQYARVFFNQSNATISFTIPIILECIGEANNARFAVQCNETGVILYESATILDRPINITRQLLVPLYQQCNISIVFSNDAGDSVPYILLFNTTLNTSSPTNTPGTTSTSSPRFITQTIIGIVAACIAILILAMVLVIVLLCYRKNKSKYPDSPGHPNLLIERVVFDGSNVRTSVDSTKGLLAFKSLTDEQPTTPTSPTGATGAAKEPIYSDLGQVPKGGAKPIQSEATVQYADINIVVPKQRATQSYDDVVVVGAGTTVIGGGPAKGGESDPPPVPKKTKGATTTQMETEETVAARNLPHHVGDGNFSSPSPPPPPLPPPYNIPVTEGRGGRQEGGGPRDGAAAEHIPPVTSAPVSTYL